MAVDVRDRDYNFALTPIYDALLAEYIVEYGHPPGQGPLTVEDIRSIKRVTQASKTAVKKAVAKKAPLPPKPGRGLGQVRVQGRR